MKRLIVLLFVLLAACAKHEPPGGGSAAHNEGEKTPAQRLQECNTQMHAKFVESSNNQMHWYEGHTSQMPDSSQRARLELGTNGKAVLLVHGFISSPAYMQDLAAPLIAAGYTVYSPLLTGFGTDAVAANAATADDWRSSIEESMSLLQTCYPEVDVVAHSLAGALITDEIQNRNLKGVAKLVLLAPYFKTEGTWPSLLYRFLGARVEAITLDTFRQITGGLDPYSYLPLTRPLPGSPEHYLPMTALGHVLELQSGFAQPSREKVPIPTLVVLSETDGVINSKFAWQYVSSNFSQVEFMTYAAFQNVPHSLQRKDSNPYFNTLMERLLGYF